ncbi:beta-propeller fold lactonase family protein [Actinomadura sp. KC06]|uniref:beta-propeller fold lactonase family protein n=1 Tax=Actinomadura sp. KC06 TaxID=2530369 RepID=UPI001404768E|nr:beta-propeller fold lactonase family protein [Actinomadura sp. KC06]
MTLPLVQSSASAETDGEEPSRRNALYVLHLFSNDIATFTLDPTTGRPTPVGDLVATGTMPRGFVFTPDGRRAYTANGGDDTISGYDVDERGELSPLGEPTPVDGQVPFGIAIAPNGKTLYTANLESGTVSALAIDANGKPHLIGKPVPTGAPQPRTVSASADGRFVFVSHGLPAKGRADVMVVFAVQPDGGLKRTLAPPVPVGSGGNGSDITPDGRFIYVASTGSDVVYGFRIANDGSLSSVPGSPFPTAVFPEDAAVTPDGRHLYVTSPNHDTTVTRNVTAFSIGRDGALRPVPGSPFESAGASVGITPSRDGRRLYVGNFETHDLAAFDIGKTGVLRQLAGSPFPTGGRNPTFQGVSVPPNQGPKAAFQTKVSDRTVRFDGTGSADPDGTIARYDWTFGDGAALQDGGPTPTHVYRRPGTYQATLTVTDDEGCGTTLIFTGQTPHCTGSPAARATRTIIVQ